MVRKSALSALFICAAATLLLAIAAPASAQERPAAAPVIGLSTGYNPQPGWTLFGRYSKMKQYLEAEFGATMKSVGSWTSSALNGVDVLIIPGRWQAIPPSSHCEDLRNWIQQGGCVIVLFNPRGQSFQFTHPDWYAFWQPSLGIHDIVLEPLGIGIRQTEASDNSMSAIAGPFDNTPYVVNLVDDSGPVRTAVIPAVTNGAKMLGLNGSGQIIAGYRQDIGAGKGSLFVLCNTYYFQNSFIDDAGNKNFLFNIISACIGASGGGGGGGDAAPDLFIKRVKGKPNVVAPGNTMKVIVKVRNKGNAASDPDTVNFYLSTNTTVDGADVYIGQIAIPALQPKKKTKQKINVLVPNLDSNFYYVVGQLSSNGKEKASKKQIDLR